MVSSVAATTARTTTTPRQQACPRCAGPLVTTYYEPECLHCGFADYSYTPPTQIGNTLMSSGTRFVFRYIGDAPRLTETLAHVRLRRINSRIVFGVTCPFCDADMEQSSLSGKRREIREERYKCPDGHRVSLIPKRDGSMGWK